MRLFESVRFLYPKDERQKMVSSQVLFGMVVSCCLLVVQSAPVDAQILPALPPSPANGVQQAGGDVTAGQSTVEVEQTSWPKITMPKITMPKITMPKITMPKITTPKATMPDFSKMMSPVNAGYQKVTAGSKKAWEGTKEMFPFGESSNPSTNTPPTTTLPKQSFLQKLIGRSPEPAAPQTVGEWMSQPRIDP